MAIAFAVDDVTPAESPRPTRVLAELLGPHMALGAPARPVIETPAIHPLLAAVHVAFAEHRPLVVSPDAIWLTIAQGAALHVRLHAEELRGRLVRHQGRKRLQVKYLGVPSTAEEWARVVGAFRSSVAELVGDGRARLLTCDFSTTTPEARVASEIVLMDVYAPYCDYELLCVCGIPEVTLLGTAEDWRAIRRRIDVIAELDLEFWTRSLAPIADQLVATAEGQQDLAFWRDIYKPEEAYGAERITGWIARLFPYCGSLGQYDQRNPLLEFPLGKLPRQKKSGPFYDGPGIASDWVPRGTSQILIDLRDGGARCGDRDVILEGGLLGVEQDEAGRLAPVAGWLARPAAASTAALIERLRGGSHELEPARPAQRPPTGSVELVTLYRELHAATLFPGPSVWRLRPRSEHERIEVTMVPGRTFDVERVLDLPDSTAVCLAYVASGRRWVRLQVEALGPLTPPESTVPIPGSDDPIVVLDGCPPRTRTRPPSARSPASAPPASSRPRVIPLPCHSPIAHPLPPSATVVVERIQISIRYTRCVDLLDDLYAGLADATYPRRLKRWAAPDLLIIDDVGLGHVRKRDDEPTAAHALFNLMDRRHGHASTAFTSNIKLSAWGRYLGDPTLAMTILDRVAMHAIPIDITGPSYRQHVADERAKKRGTKLPVDLPDSEATAQD